MADNTNNNLERDNLSQNLLSNYRGRFSAYWIERWGLIPELPTSFDNANSIYELLAWLQRAFKNLLDDFQALESEFDDFKNALIDLLEYLIPELIKRFAHSEEFRNIFTELLKDLLTSDLYEWFKDYLKDLMNDPEMKEFFKEYFKTIMSDPAMKEWFKEYFKDLMTDPAMQEWFKEYFKELMTDPAMQEWFKEYFNTLINDPEFIKDLKDKLGITTIENALKQIINNLISSGAWTGNPDTLTGTLVSGRNIATGNINIFGGTPDGNSFIRTNNGATENDLAGGI